MTTLADLTEEQRAECVGMWFDTIFGLGILEALQEEPKEGEPFGRFRHPDRDSWHTESFKRPTPRFDLPRAWNPDGTPPQGEWETETDTDYLIIWDRGYEIRVSNGCSGIDISPQDIKPLALALLAHHYRNQRAEP